MHKESGFDVSGKHSDDVEGFVADKEAELLARLEIDPVTDEKIDEVERKSGEREELGL